MPETPDVPQQNCPACGIPVNTAEAEPLARVACPGCGEKFQIERAFDNFVLVETLGVGGMGSVYKARDTRLERFVALKLLRKELSADPVEAQRLAQEARVTAAVNHPNVVQVYSSGTAHGQIYLVMELVDHGSLEDLMAEHARVPEAKALLAGIQVAKGLQAAHEKGLIHRDVKPANILFSDANTAKIGDFGLAGAAEQKIEGKQEIWGTPYYVAPERLNNEPEDFRSDIYSLGATLFHALAGRPSMEGETTSASELRNLKSHPPDLRAVAPDVSPETARIINRMLAPKPENRFTSYAHVIEQLLGAYRALSPGGQVAAAQNRSARFWKFAAGAACLAVLAAIAFYFVKNRQNPGEPNAPSTAITQTAENTAALQQRYEEARHQLLEGKYDAAATAFNRLTTEAGNTQPLLNWIRLHTGLTALLQGKLAPAREAFHQIEQGGNFSEKKADADLAHFFVETSRALAAPGPIQTGSEGDSKSVQAFAPFLFAVKDWQLSEFNESATLFGKFTQSEPAGEFAWINEYKGIAQKYLGDHVIYTEWKALPRPSGPAEMKAAAAKVHELEGKLQLRGVLADAMNEDAKRLSNAGAIQEKTEKEAAEKSRKELFEKESALWEPALADAQAAIARYDFAAASSALDKVQLTEPSLTEARVTERKKVAWLIQWKARLVADLKTGLYKTPIALTNNNYQGVAGANEREITLRIGQYGGAPFKWDKFTADVLLKMSVAFIRPNTPDTADRQWLSAIFAGATGQAEAGRVLGDAAAKAKPEYREALPILTKP